METLRIQKRPELITNGEVLQLLQERRKAREEEAGGKKKPRKVRHRDWIETHVIQFLEETTHNVAKPGDLVKQLRKDFKLTKAETLQILNFMPRESVEIHLIIEDLQTRMSSEKQDELLALIAKYADQASATDQEKQEENDDNDNMDIVEEKKSADDGDIAIHTNGDAKMKTEPR